MMLLALVVFALFQIALGGTPEVPCPVPLSPEHGQSFLYHDGQVVKYICEPGFVLKGKETVRCVDGQWEDPNPTCVEFGEPADPTQQSEGADTEPLPPALPRPLFDWNSGEDSEEERNSTSEEMPLSDEARVRLLLYPRRRVVHSGRLQSATELEEEEKKRSQDGAKSVYLESPPSVVYVRRTIIPGKSETSRRALHMTVENGQDVEVVSVPRAAVAQNDKGQQYDDYWRQLYYYNHYNYPRAASLVDYRNGVPRVVTLTDSQLAWINSLHPELRDQYLKDMYVVRAGDVAESERAQAIIRRYDDAYNYYYHLPYLRQPVSSSYYYRPAAAYDYSCNSAGNPHVTAPSLPNMRVARYDSRKNVDPPHNHYLSAVYQCDPGYYMLDARFSELYCSKGTWVGVPPTCVRHPVVVEDPVAKYDYSCHQSGRPFVKAPRLPHAQIARYDQRQNPNQPHNYYLTAIYRCHPGYVMLDTRFTELNCSDKQWVGARPVCVRRN